jgi:hypothetical protein
MDYVPTAGLGRSSVGACVFVLRILVIAMEMTTRPISED